MCQENLAGTFVALHALVKPSSRSHRVLHHAPEAVDGVEGGATMGREAVAAQRAGGGVACRVELGRSMSPVSSDAGAGGREGGEPAGRGGTSPPEAGQKARGWVGLARAPCARPAAPVVAVSRRSAKWVRHHRQSAV